MAYVPEDLTSPLSSFHFQHWKEPKEHLPERVKEPAPSNNGEFFELLQKLNHLQVRPHWSPTPGTTMDIIAAQGWASQAFHSYSSDGRNPHCNVLNYKPGSDKVLSNTLQLT